MKDNKAVFAIYRTREELRNAVRALKRIEVEDRQMGIIATRSGGPKDFPQVQKSQGRNGAIVGAIFGGTLMGILYLFIGAGLISLPVTHEMSWASSAFLGLAGIALGILVGAAIGLLVGNGTPDPLAKRYGQYLQTGGLLLVVHVVEESQIERVESVILATGGQDVHLAKEDVTLDSATMESIRPSDLQLERTLAGEPQPAR